MTEYYLPETCMAFSGLFLIVSHFSMDFSLLVMNKDLLSVTYYKRILFICVFCSNIFERKQKYFPRSVGRNRLLEKTRQLFSTI